MVVYASYYPSDGLLADVIPEGVYVCGLVETIWPPEWLHDPLVCELVRQRHTPQAADAIMERCPESATARALAAGAKLEVER